MQSYDALAKHTHVKLVHAKSQPVPAGYSRTYTIYPPLPYLQSDESLIIHFGSKKVTGKFPLFRFCKTERSPDRDVLYLWGPKKLVFEGNGYRTHRDRLLKTVASLSLTERPLPLLVQDACADIIARTDYDRVVWNGYKIKAKAPVGTEVDQRDSDIDILIDKAQRACKLSMARLPFTYPATHT